MQHVRSPALPNPKSRTKRTVLDIGAAMERGNVNLECGRKPSPLRKRKNVLESPVVLVRFQEFVAIEEAALVPAHTPVRDASTSSISRGSRRTLPTDRGGPEGGRDTHRYTLLSP